jgi:hypothetical protein
MPFPTMAERSGRAGIGGRYYVSTLVEITGVPKRAGTKNTAVVRVSNEVSERLDGHTGEWIERRARWNRIDG